MPGRGRGRLMGPGPSSGPKIGENARTSTTSGSKTDDSFKPVPFYTNMYGRITREQYEKNKNDPKLHPDTAGLGEFYVGSMPWHVRCQGRIWIPREERPTTVFRPKKSRTKPKKEPKTLELPKNEESVARDFDIVSDEVEISCSLLSWMLWDDYVKHKDDPVPRDIKANFFHPTIRPKFPPFTKGNNPFSVLPTTANGIFPFDEYGAILFDKPTIARWQKDPKARAELLEVQIRQLIILYELDRNPPIYSESAEVGSYGATAPVYTGPPVRSMDQDKKSGTESAEPDSGFVSVEPEVDPWSGNGDTVPPNEYSWEPRDGSGYVPLSAFLPHAIYAHTQVNLDRFSFVQT